jgi:hypothetical protein
MSDEESDASDSPRAPDVRLHGLPAPAREYWSDEEQGHATWREAAASEPRAGQAPPVTRKFGGTRLDEPLSWPLVGRLALFVAVLSLCLTSCEVLTMWASFRVSWAWRPRFPLGLFWSALRCACALALPYWCAGRGVRAAKYLTVSGNSLVCAFGLLKYPSVWKARHGGARLCTTTPQTLAGGYSSPCSAHRRRAAQPRRLAAPTSRADWRLLTLRLRGV